MNLLVPGMYVPVDSPLHRLDPRVKLGAGLLLMALPFTTQSPAGALSLSACVLAIALLSRAPLLPLLRTLAGVLWVGCVMFVFYLFTTAGEPLFTVATITATQQGLRAGAVQVYRICLVTVVAVLLTFTTSPAQLAHGLDALLGPLARLGLPVQELTLVLTIALRFVPTLFDDVERIATAQQARGADVRAANPWRRVRSWVPMFVPIFVSAFRHADELTTAMEARGFRGARDRTRLHQLHLGWAELAASLVVLAAGLTVLALERLQ